MTDSEPDDPGDPAGHMALPWYRTVAWVFFVVDVVLLLGSFVLGVNSSGGSEGTGATLVLSGVGLPAAVVAVMAFAVFGATLNVFYRLHNDIHLTGYALLRANVRIPLGLGTGAAIVVFDEIALQIPELATGALGFATGLYAERAFTALRRNVGEFLPEDERGDG